MPAGVDYSKWDHLEDSDDERLLSKPEPPLPTVQQQVQTKTQADNEHASKFMAKLTKGLATGTPSASLEDAATRLAACKQILLFTGAGISTDSGIPDFRGPNGLWTKNPGAKEASHIANYMSSAEARHGSWNFQMMFATSGQDGGAPRPNAGHYACAEISATGRVCCTVTQNIDALHQAAGSTNVIEAHGGVSSVVCLKCKVQTPMPFTLARVSDGDGDPACLICGGMLKPDVVMFGEQLDEAKLQAAEKYARTADALVAIGSSLAVAPVNELVPMAKRAGAVVIIVNLGPTAFDNIVDFRLSGSISALLPDLFRLPSGSQSRHGGAAANAALPVT
jgi:NAD-dependent deacetylase